MPMACVSQVAHVSPPFGEVIVTVGASMLKVALLTSKLLRSDVLLAFIKQVVELIDGTVVQINDPSLGVDDVINIHDKPLLTEYSN